MTQWFSRFHPAEPAIEIRAPDAKVAWSKDLVPIVRRFAPGAYYKAATDAYKLSGTARAIYVVLNGIDPALPRRGKLGGGASAKDIPRRLRLLIDCDPVRPSDTNATDDEKQEAKQVAHKIWVFLSDRGWPEPFKGDSGNGHHLIYVIDLPNDDDSTALVKAVLAALAAKFDTDRVKVDQVVFDAPRLVKFYGTLAAKGENSEERPHRYSRMTQAPVAPRPVPTELLRELAAEAPPKAFDLAAEIEAKREQAEAKPILPIDEHLRASSKRPDAESRAAAYLDRCEPAISGNRGHNAAFKAACKIGPGFDLPTDVAFRLLATRYNPRCVPPWSEKDLMHKVDDSYKVEARRGFLRDADRKGYEGNSKRDNGTEHKAPGPKPDHNGFDYRALTRAQLGLTRASDIKGEPVDWLWDDRVPLGMLTLLAGEGSDGKSQITIAIAAAVSTGGKLPDGTKAPLGRVIILAAEDSTKKTIIPRLIAAGADMRNVDILTAKVTQIDEKGRTVIHPQCLADLGYWRAVFSAAGEGQPDTSLFIADTLPGLMKGINDSRNNEIRGLMEPFIDDVIDPMNIAMIGITHMNKSIDHKTPVNKILGSVAYPNLSRSVFCTYRDPEDKTRKRRFMCHVKINVGDERPTLGYSVEKVEVDIDGTAVKTARVVFEEAAVDLSAQDIMAAGRDGKRPGPKPVETEKNAVWLFDFLNGNAGWTRLGDIINAAGAAGMIGVQKEKDGKLKWSALNNLYRAKDHLPSLPSPRQGKRVGDEKFDNRAAWKLIDASAPF